MDGWFREFQFPQVQAYLTGSVIFIIFVKRCSGMEVGYDYTLVGVGPPRSPWVFSALFLVIFGTFLLAVGGVFYGFSANAQADQTMVDASGSGEAIDAARGDNSVSLSNPGYGAGRLSGRIVPPSRMSDSAIAGQQLYPAGLAQVEFWVNPLAYEP